ncbi:MAG: PadR family transcriptional regulator [Pseudobdellovibrionaceae bacterium]
MSDSFLYSGLIRLHILHHAVEEGIYGLGIKDELERHGYKISAGTLYPMLHSMEERGYLASKEAEIDRSRRKVYRATKKGTLAMQDAKAKVQELFGELFEGGSQKHRRKKP